MKARTIIIDTDPGQDDAVAILLALASPELEVLGITCVAGNVPLPLTATSVVRDGREEGEEVIGSERRTRSGGRARAGR